MTTTEMPTTTTTLAPFQNCAIAWENFLAAKLDGIEENTTDFAARVGYIEPPTRPINRIQLIDEFLELKNKNLTGGERYNISGWITSNDWIKKLKWDDGLRYLPLPLQNGTDQVLKMRMSILVLRCDFAAFGISPLPYDVILSKNSEVKHNWTQDFDHLADCKQRYRDLTNGTNVSPENRVFKFKDQTDINKPKYLVLHFDVGIQFQEGANKLISKQQIEAAKYKFGYTIPLRDETFNESYDNYKRVVAYGLHLLPIDLSFGQLKSYIVQITFKRISFGFLVKNNVANEADKEEWLDKMMTLQVKQDLFVCGGIKTNFFTPRMTTTAKIDGSGKYFYDQGDIYEVYDQSGLVGSYTYVDTEFYKLYEERDY